MLDTKWLLLTKYLKSLALPWGDLNPCFRRERAGTPLQPRSENYKVAHADLLDGSDKQFAEYLI
jgi:hypothetical protein